MRFSILLPTRNRLEYLKLAVASVRRQSVADWELVVSDNASEEDISGYIRGLDDRRIVYIRGEEMVPVTENWNRALAASSGEYVVMLGDDDALLGDYLARMEELIARFSAPELIYTKALLFSYPGVDPSFPRGFVMDHGCARFFAGASEPFVLDHENAIEMVQGALSFRVLYDFNAQFALVSRALIERLAEFGPFYQSAFPDYYSMNAAFLAARKIVVDPEPAVAIGVTPKSYGFFHLNDKEEQGRSFLDGPAQAEQPKQAGTNINVGWLSAMEALERGIGGRSGLRVDRRRYRFVQASYVYKRYRAGTGSLAEVREVEGELPVHERIAYRVADRGLQLLHRVLPQRLKERLLHLLVHRVVAQHPYVPPSMVEGRYANILELCEDRDVTRSAAA